MDFSVIQSLERRIISRLPQEPMSEKRAAVLGRILSHDPIIPITQNTIVITNDRGALKEKWIARP